MLAIGHPPVLLTWKGDKILVLNLLSLVDIVSVGIMGFQPAPLIIPNLHLLGIQAAILAKQTQQL